MLNQRSDLLETGVVSHFIVLDDLGDWLEVFAGVVTLKLLQKKSVFTVDHFREFVHLDFDVFGHQKSHLLLEFCWPYKIALFKNVKDAEHKPAVVNLRFDHLLIVVENVQTVLFCRSDVVHFI